MEWCGNTDWEQCTQGHSVMWRCTQPKHLTALSRHSGRVPSDADSCCRAAGCLGKETHTSWLSYTICVASCTVNLPWKQIFPKCLSFQTLGRSCKIFQKPLIVPAGLYYPFPCPQRNKRGWTLEIYILKYS